MKAVVLTGLRQMELRDVPEPKLEKDTDVLLKIEMVGVCGSDIHNYVEGRTGSLEVKFPMIPGHECSAVVEGYATLPEDKKIYVKMEKIRTGKLAVLSPMIGTLRMTENTTHRSASCQSGWTNAHRKPSKEP